MPSVWLRIRVRVRNGRLIPRGAAWLPLVLALVGCGPSEGVTVLSDAAFVFADVSVPSDVSSGDVTGAGCAIYASNCSGETCCAAPTSRCIPGASGVGVCVAPGSLSLGERCGFGPTTCGDGALCASNESGDLVCRAVCTDGLLDCGGAECLVVMEVNGEQIRLCET